MKKLKNFIITCLCKLFSPKPNPPGCERRFLIVSTTALGDTLWATPAILALRESFPNSLIAVLTSSVGNQVLKTNPHINQIFVIPKSLFSYYFLRKNLLEKKFDTVFIFHASQRIVPAVCATIGATHIIGSQGKNKDLDELLTICISPSYQHEISRRLDLVKTQGAKTSRETLFFQIDPNDAYDQNFSNAIILHPGSKDPFRRWPSNHYAEVGNQLSSLGYQIILSGVESEIDLLKELKEKIPSAILLKSNRSLHQFAKIIQNAKLLITNDTGPLHLASALDIPTIGIFAGSDPLLFGGHVARNTLCISSPIPCTPCLKRKCLRSFCFLQITPEIVFLESKKLLNKQNQN